MREIHAHNTDPVSLQILAAPSFALCKVQAERYQKMREEWKPTAWQPEEKTHHKHSKEMRNACRPCGNLSSSAWLKLPKRVHQNPLFFVSFSELPPVTTLAMEPPHLVLAEAQNPTSDQQTQSSLCGSSSHLGERASASPSTRTPQIGQNQNIEVDSI